MSTHSKALLILIGVASVLIGVSLFLNPIPQPLSYHNFADHRSWLRIPNFGDVMSNVPFAIIGLWGLIAILQSNATFADRRERWPYLILFAGLVLTAFGSGYYHLAPDNARLVWDRIPINITIMALLAAVIMERISLRAGLLLFPFLEVIGIASVLAWSAGEAHGHGDLRFYAAVQIYAVVVLLLSPLLPAKCTRRYDFMVVVAFYVLAKFLEEADRQIFALGHIASGHTLKHLAAAASGYWILRMLQRRHLAVTTLKNT